MPCMRETQQGPEVDGNLSTTKPARQSPDKHCSGPS